MASVANRATNPLLRSVPHFLQWRSLGFRTVCSGRLGFATRSENLAAADERSSAAGTKHLEVLREEFEVGSRLISFETGKIARFANGSVVMAMEETKVLSTVTSSKSGEVRDFLPLTVDYQEKQFAQGVIPNTFMRREGAPKERELLCGRIIDRPIRPLFPKGFYHEVQVIASVLSCDGKQDPDVMAANATSTALMLSDIPWGGPIGMVRLGRISGQFIVNPTMDELSISDLNLIYACTKDKTLMIDVQAREISEKDLEAGLRLAHPEAVKYIEPQIRLAARAGKQKKIYTLSMISDKTMDRVRELAEAPIEAVFTDSTYGKFERGEALENITKDVKNILEEEGDGESLKVLPKVVDSVRKEIVRRRIIDKGLRLDGRALDEVRPVFCESGSLPQLHGSSIFSRGDTQVLCTVTLGSPADAQNLTSIIGPSKKRFMLHYSFPPFSINEVGKRAGLNRREVGHGTLAEKALLSVLPPEDDFPYTVRINSEVMASDGSTSMATVCGGSMALMDAGLPLREHVAGVSVGLFSDVDPSTGDITDYRILTDILGLEDHLGDMDFKIAGTRKGVTSSQLDIKPAGIPLDIICESLGPARRGRLQILDHMEREINAPRSQDAKNSPQIVTLKYSNDLLRRLVGPLGAIKRKLEEETGARLAVSDGALTIMTKNQYVMDLVQDKIEFMLGREIEVGGIYKGIVTTVKEYGAFVEFNGGQQGLLHISELSHAPVTKVSDVVAVGQTLSLMCIGQDVRGNIKLSLKATMSPQSDLVGEESVKKPIFPTLKEMGEFSVSEEIDEGEEQSESSDFPMEVQSQENTEGVIKTPSSSVPVILIRTAAECEEEEKAAGLTKKSKSQPKPSVDAKAKDKSSASNRKSKSNSKPSGNKDAEEKKTYGSSQKSPSKSKPSSSSVSEADKKKNSEVPDVPSLERQNPKLKLKTAYVDRISELLQLDVHPTKDVNTKNGNHYQTKEVSSRNYQANEVSSRNYQVKEVSSKNYLAKEVTKVLVTHMKLETQVTAKVHQVQKGDRNQTKEETKGPVTKRNLKLGSQVTAKVDQVRAHGLVLDLGNGLRGMLRFENGKTDYEIGQELRVKCSSFSTKGIPVMRLLNN